jgi:integrase/recombinase XerC/integrase/recombinase XerD
MLELARGTGLRADELVNLDIVDLDPDSELLRVAGEPAHGAVGRWLERGRPALLEATGRTEPALFVSRSGRRLSASDVRRRLALATRAGRATIGTSSTYTRVESKRLCKAYASAHPRA